MSRWDRRAILGELRRQLGWRAATIERLERERERLEAQKARLLARRSSYKPKNNGKGRPPKEIPEFPRDKLSTLARTKVEAGWLHAALEPISAAQSPLHWLEDQLTTLDVPNPSGFEQIQLNFVKRLIEQFRQVPRPNLQLQPWSQKQVRRYFLMAERMQAQKLKSLSDTILMRDLERLEYDRHMALHLALKQILSSHHLSNAARFLEVLRIWSVSSPNYEPQLPALWVRTWQEALRSLHEDLAAVFVMDQGP